MREFYLGRTKMNMTLDDFQAVRSPVHDPELLFPSGQLPPKLVAGTNLDRGIHNLFSDCGIYLKLHIKNIRLLF